MSLLSIMSKLFENLLINRVQPIIEQEELIPDHQLDFGQEHATVEQIQQVTMKISHRIRNRKY